MAVELTIIRPDLFPTGTKVKAFKLPVPLPGELIKRNVGSPANWTPALVEAFEATAEAGKLLFAAAIEKQPYILWANVGGEDRYLQVRATPQVEVV